MFYCFRIFFIFHKNSNAHFKAKVKPPRLNGSKTGVFSTRSPYRPNNIGLTLAKIECVKGMNGTLPKSLCQPCVIIIHYNNSEKEK